VRNVIDDGGKNAWPQKFLILDAVFRSYLKSDLCANAFILPCLPGGDGGHHMHMACSAVSTRCEFIESALANPAQRRYNSIARFVIL
jgi:hypothetical protein